MNHLANRHLQVAILSLVLGCLFPISILGQQDDAPLQQQDQVILMYRLMHADPELIRDVAGSIQGSDKLRIAIDPSTNSLIVSADSKTHDQLKALITKLDCPAEPAAVSKPAPPVSMVVQLITDFGADPASVPVDTRIRKILEEAEAGGLIRPIKEPHSIAHSMISVNPAEQNNSGGRIATVSSATGQRVRLKLDGILQDLGEESFQLSTKIEITLRQPMINQPADVPGEKAETVSAQIQTDTSLYKNHPVLLSVNTIEGRSFLIMVEVK